jgi:hypothetical protein
MVRPCRDRAEPAGADPGERDAADQRGARPGPVQHAVAGRGEARRGGRQGLQLRVGPRRDAGRHGQAVRGGRGRRRRGYRALRPRRRRRRRQEGLPVPQHGKRLLLPRCSFLILPRPGRAISQSMLRAGLN